MQDDMVSQRVALRVAVLEKTAFPAHASLRQICEEMASYTGYSCKSNNDLSQLRPHDAGRSLYFSTDYLQHAVVDPMTPFSAGPKYRVNLGDIRVSLRASILMSTEK